MAQLAADGCHTVIREVEPGLTGIGTEPGVGVGQRGMLIQTPEGNLLWDAAPFIDEAAVEAVRAAGGLRAVSSSHPHMYGAAVEWSHAFKSVPVYIHARDRKFVPRHDAVIQFWVEDEVLLAEGLRIWGHRSPLGSAALLE